MRGLSVCLFPVEGYEDCIVCSVVVWTEIKKKSMKISFVDFFMKYEPKPHTGCTKMRKHTITHLKV